MSSWIADVVLRVTCEGWRLRRCDTAPDLMVGWVVGRFVKQSIWQKWLIGNNTLCQVQVSRPMRASSSSVVLGRPGTLAGLLTTQGTSIVPSCDPPVSLLCSASRAAPRSPNVVVDNAGAFSLPRYSSSPPHLWSGAE